MKIRHELTPYFCETCGSKDKDSIEKYSGPFHQLVDAIKESGFRMQKQF